MLKYGLIMEISFQFNYRIAIPEPSNPKVIYMTDLLITP